MASTGFASETPAGHETPEYDESGFMTTMFINNLIKTYDLEQTSDELKLNYLGNVVQRPDLRGPSPQGSRWLAAAERRQG